MRFDAYIRVSDRRGREGETFISPDVQRDEIRQWAKLRKVEIAAEFEDMDQPGWKEDRPGFNEILRRIQAKETDGIVVWKVTRFSRSLPRALESVRIIHEAGGKISSVVEGIDPTTTTGKMMFSLLLLLADYEADTIGEQWAIAQERAVRRGVYIAHQPPTGYTRGADGRLHPDPEAAAVVARAFEMRAAGSPWSEVAEMLTASGVRSWSEAERWTGQATKRLVENRVYLGESRFGKFVNPDAHEPLVGQGLWIAAQRARGGPAVRSDHPALLAGLLRCAGCRYVMKPAPVHRDGRTVAYRYACQGDHPGGRCQDKAFIVAHLIEPFVEEAFLAQAGQTRAAQVADGSEDLEGAVREAEEALRLYRDDPRVAGALGGSDAAVFIEGLELRMRALEDAQAELAAADTGVFGLPVEVELGRVWPEFTVPQKQRLLRTMIDCVVLRRGRGVPVHERAVILWRGEAPADLPARGRRVPLRPFDWPPRPAEAVG